MRDIATGTVLLCSLLGLGGCLDAGPNLRGVTGSGDADGPYVLPDENQTNLTQGIEDYLAVDGFWKFNYYSIEIQAAGETEAEFGDIIYDTRTNTWTVTVDGADYSLASSAGIYQSAACGGPGTCVELLIYDANPLTSQYGTFGRFSRDDGENVSVAQIYYGLKTPSADMPSTGTASYTGDFVGQVGLAGGPIYDATSTVTIDANFATGGIVYTSAGGTVDDGGAGAFTLSGTATITGNVYTGTDVTGAYDGLTFDQNGMLEGAFYGPLRTETAGAISAETEDGDVMYGGFWANP